MTELHELRQAGMVTRRLRGGYRPTRRGLRYLRDVILRNPELRAAMGEAIERWEAGDLTKDGRREALIDLIGRGWEWDGVQQAEAMASLRAQGFDPLAALEVARNDMDTTDDSMIEQACVDEGLLEPAFGGMVQISKKGTEYVKSAALVDPVVADAVAEALQTRLLDRRAALVSVLLVARARDAAERLDAEA